MNEIRITALVIVDQKNRTNFEMMTKELKNLVLQHEVSDVLGYEYYFKSQISNECFIHEIYRTKESFEHHMKLISPIIKKYDNPFEVERLEICGIISQTTLIKFEGMYANRFINYNSALL